MVNVNLGTPYEIILENAIKQGYAGNSTEAIRQALLVYEKELEKREEAMLIKKANTHEMQKMKKSKRKSMHLDDAIKNGVFD